MSRFLVVHPGPNFSVADVHTGWVEALGELGHKVLAFNLDDRLTFYHSTLLETGAKDPRTGAALVRKALSWEQAKAMAVNGIAATAYKFVPEVALVISAFFVPVAMLDLLRERGTRVVLVHTESPYQDAEQLGRAEHADLNLINDPTNLDAFRQVGPAEYFPHAYRPAVHYPGPATPAMLCDLAFVGTGFPSRIAFFEAMAATGELTEVDVMLAGQWQELQPGSPIYHWLATDPEECLDNAQTAALYRSARLGLNIYRGAGEFAALEAEGPDAADGWALGPREVEMAACGLPFLRQARGEGDELLPMLPVFDGPDEAAKLVRAWLSEPQRATDAAMAARAAIDDRTFLHGAARLLRRLDKLPRPAR